MSEYLGGKDRIGEGEFSREKQKGMWNFLFKIFSKF